MINKLLLIPDTHISPGANTDHLDHIGRFIVDEQPEVVLHIGDVVDLRSLSSYDKGKKSAEGQRYKADCESGVAGMTRLLGPLHQLQDKQRRNKEKVYKPRQVLCIGNHENRINRAAEDNAFLDGHISIKDLKFEEFGWEVIPFLEVVEIEGIAFSHYFTGGLYGRPVSSAKALLTSRFQSCVMGHVQRREISHAHRPDGTQITGLFCGTAYPHEEDYLGPQTHYFRGIYILKNIVNGDFEAVPYTLDELRSSYS